MKSFFSLFMLAVAMMAYCGTICAQNSNKQRLNREELAEKQARHIANEMVMDDTIAERFVETYCQYQKEIWALGPRTGKNSRRNAPSETDVETEQEIKDRFEHSQKILDIRQKYYKEYSKFLTQKQIKRVYELERQIMDRLSKRKGNGNRNKR